MGEYQGKRALVVGLGSSGRAAARFLVQQGARVVVNDHKPAEELTSTLKELADLELETILGGHPEGVFTAADLIVLSPGVPRDLAPLKKAVAQGVPVLSELEFAARHVAADMIAVTGTNGKSTVVSLIGEMLKAELGAESVFVGGNLGTPLTELLLQPRPVKAAVVEVSSFQLEYAPTLHPRIAVMLNLTPDHLDRYRDFEDYAETKWRLFANLGPEDFAVLNLDDPACAEKAGSLLPRVIGFSLLKAPAFGMWLSGEVLEYRTPEGLREELPVKEVPLHGQHNLMNVMAAFCAARAYGIPLPSLRRAVSHFKALAHRLNLVREWRGIKFYNDSKATNVGSVEADVMGLSGPLILLMGGQAKGCSFVELGERIKSRVKKVVAFGECRHQLEVEMGDKLPVVVVEDISQALQAAVASAVSGDNILLAPGGASFDQFRDYRHRGEVFTQLVKELS